MANAQLRNLMIIQHSLYLIDESDTVMLMDDIEQIGIPYQNVIPFVRNSQVGLMDSSFKIVLAPQFQQCGSDLEFHGGLLKVSKGDQGMGYVDTSGKEMIKINDVCSCCFDNHWATSYNNGSVIVYNGSYHITDSTNESFEMTSEVTQYSESLQDHYEDINPGGLVLFKTSELMHGVIMNGNVCISPLYPEIIFYQSDSPGIWADCKDEHKKHVCTYYIDPSRNTVTKYQIEE